MSAFATLLALAAIILAVPVCVLVLEVLFAVPAHSTSPMPAGPRPTVAVVVPAHDEAAVIGDTLRGLRAQLMQCDRLLVVADNCTDDTAEIARHTGADVVERFSDQKRGKGYALDYGVRQLEHSPPDVVVILDADCEAEPDAIERIARRCGQSGRPVQALYLMKSSPNSGVGRRIAEFAWLVKNRVRPLGALRMGVPCQLMGTGMAIPWTRVKSARLATGHIAEDVLFGINLAMAGTPPLFCPDAVVTSTFPDSEAGAASQRRRWEHGNLALIVSEAPRLLLHGVARLDMPLIGMALDLAVPPIALLAMLVAGLLGAAAAVALWWGLYAPLGLSAVVMSLLFSAMLLSWVRYGRDVLSLRDMACAPIYALRKIPIYLGFLTKRQVEWVRTRRDG